MFSFHGTMVFFFCIFMVLLILFVVVATLLTSSVLYEKMILKRLKSRTGELVTVFIICGIELLFTWAVSYFFEWRFIDTLFMTSLLFLSIMWMAVTSKTTSDNEAKAEAKYYEGVDTGKEYAVSHFEMSPARLGTILFGVIGFVASFTVYLPYFM